MPLGWTVWGCGGAAAWPPEVPLDAGGAVAPGFAVVAGPVVEEAGAPDPLAGPGWTAVAAV